MLRCGLAWIALAACYRPHADRECAIACDFSGAGAQAACPAGMACASPGFCIDDGSATTCAPGDAAGDDTADAELPFCYGTAPEQACFAAPPNGSITLGDVATDSCIDGVHLQVGGVTTCVIAGASIKVSRNIVATGGLRLMLVGTQSLMIDAGAGIDLSAIQGGAASSTTVCAASVNAPAASGGGAGGSFQGLGGNGSGVGAGARGAALPAAFRGGCAGGTSGSTPGGRAGGAIYLVSESQIIVGGAINASGSGGSGGVLETNGGGGGGSGGFIGLDAPAITIGGLARLLSAGGGGGGGGDTAPPLPGHLGGPGGDPTIAQPIGAGGIVTSQGTGGPGGSGSSPTNLDGQSGGAPGSNGQGGGGGGGAGVIEFFKALTSCVPPTCVPGRIVF